MKKASNFNIRIGFDCSNEKDKTIISLIRKGKDKDKYFIDYCEEIDTRNLFN